jgi:hypothetical protein
MDLREIRWGGMSWIDLVQNRDQWKALVSTVMNLRLPYIAEKFFSSCTITGFSKRTQLHEISFSQYLDYITSIGWVTDEYDKD